MTKGMRRYIETKKKKEVAHLPVQQAVYVPSTTAKSKKISPQEHRKRITEVKKFLSNRFGGFTKVGGEGGYTDKEKGIIQEKVAIVYSYAEKNKFRKHKGALITQLSKWRKKWGQDSMGYEHEGDMYYIGGKKEPKTRKISSATRKKLLKNLIKARKVRAKKLGGRK
jgi:hypothetical protein